MNQQETEKCLDALELLASHGVLGGSAVRAAYRMGVKQGESKSDMMKVQEAQWRAMAGQG